MAVNSRRYHRFPIFAKAIIRSRGGLEKFQLESQVTNINQGGMGMYIGTPLTRSTPVSVELSFTTLDGAGVKNTMEGRVVSLCREADQFFMGISFDHEISHESIMNLIYGDQ